MRSAVQQTLLECLAPILRPLVRLLLSAGVGYVEFAAVAKSIFVQVASESFGLRGRPTNVSRVSAMTAISRKEVTRIRKHDSSDRWTPNMETTPANTVIHHWHYDPKYSLAPGDPKPLPFQGAESFSSLVAEYAGDIPPGAMRSELQRVATIKERSDGLLLPDRRYFYSAQFDTDFIKRIAFSLANLSSTVVHNAELFRHSRISEAENDRLGRFERCAWTEYMPADARDLFRAWVRKQGVEFIEQADEWIGKNEYQKQGWQASNRRSIGVGVYYFEEDS